jgi:hypothetical protein
MVLFNSKPERAESASPKMLLHVISSRQHANYGFIPICNGGCQGRSLIYD